MTTVVRLAVVNGASGALLGTVLVLVPHLLSPGAALPSVAYAAASGAALGLGIWSGPWGDRHGLSPLLRASTVLLVGSAPLCLASDGLAAAVLSVGTGLAVGLTYVPGLSVVALGPVDRRPRRLALLVSGNAVGMFVGPLLAGLGAGRWPAGTAAAAMVLAGLVHLAAARALPSAAPAAAVVARARPVPLTRRLRRLGLATACGAAGVTGMVALFVPTALADGASARAAAALPATAAAAALVGRLLLLVRGSGLPPATVMRSGALLVGCCACGLAVVGGHSGTGVAAVVVAGLAQGAWVAALPGAVVDEAAQGADRAAQVGAALGRIYACAAAGTVAGPLVAGPTVDAAGTGAGFGVCAALAAAGAWGSPGRPTPVTTAAERVEARQE